MEEHVLNSIPLLQRLARPRAGAFVRRPPFAPAAFAGIPFILAIAALLQANPNPGPGDIAALPNICRCGAQPRIRRAIDRAAAAMAASGPPNAERQMSSRLSNGSLGEEQKPSQ